MPLLSLLSLLLLPPPTLPLAPLTAWPPALLPAPRPLQIFPSLHSVHKSPVPDTPIRHYLIRSLFLFARLHLTLCVIPPRSPRYRSPSRACNVISTTREAPSWHRPGSLAAGIASTPTPTPSSHTHTCPHTHTHITPCLRSRPPNQLSRDYPPRLITFGPSAPAFLHHRARIMRIFIFIFILQSLQPPTTRPPSGPPAVLPVTPVTAPHRSASPRAPST